MKPTAFVRVALICTALGFPDARALCEGQSNQISLESDSLMQQNSPVNPASDKQREDSSAFSEEVAEHVVHELGEGLTQHNARRMLRAFDSDAMDGYTNFQNQIQAMFQQYDSFRVHFRIASIEATDEGGTATVDFEMEQIPRSTEERLPVRKAEKLRLQMKAGKKGWKIVELQPRDFFS
jgi:hypothetical protein